MSTALMSFGALCILWGSAWMSWDHLAIEPGWMVICGAACLVIGMALS